jgi:plasmid maintenance system antidote protein VapI
MQVLLICVALCSVAAAAIFGWKYRAVIQRFKPVLSLDEEAERIRRDTERKKAESARELERAKAEVAEAVGRAKAKATELTLAYDKAKDIYLRLQNEVSLLQATSEDMSFGLYKPQYSFDTS